MIRTRNLTVRVALAVVFALAALAARAQQQPTSKPSQSEMKRQLAEMADRVARPTEAHKMLAPFVGRFDQITEVRMGPGEPLKSHSIGVGQWIMGGRFVKFESASAPDEELKGERMIVYGYDPQAKKYTLWNIETMSLTASTAVGDYDAAAKTFTFDGERDAPGGGKAPFRWVVKVQPDGVLAQQILMKPPGAADFVPVVSVTHTPIAK